MKQEQYNKLQEYRQYLIQAKSNFCRISNSNLRALADIYFELNGKRLSPQQLNCTSCVLKMLKELAKQCENYEEWYKGRFKKMPGEETTEPVANSNPIEPEPVE